MCISFAILWKVGRREKLSKKLDFIGQIFIFLWRYLVVWGKMQISYRDHHLEKLANGIGDHKYPEGIGKKYRAVLHEIEKMKNVKEILQKIGWYAERKKGDRSDQIGIHLNKGRRLMIKVEGNIVNIILVREITNHYE